MLQVHPVHEQPWDVQPHKHFQRFPEPAYITAQHFQTSSTAHKLLLTDGGTVLPLGDLDPVQSPEFPENAAEEQLPVIKELRL